MRAGPLSGSFAIAIAAGWTAFVSTGAWAQINPNAHPMAGVYDEQTTQSNTVDFNASAMSAKRFAARVRDAYLQNRGGVLDATVLGQYASLGRDNIKQFSVGWGSQGIGSPASQATPISGTGAFGTPSKTSGFSFLGFDYGGLPNERPVEVGLTCLSQAGASFGTVTVSGRLDNGVLMPASRTFSESAGAGDTFYGFTAPPGRYFTGMDIAHNSPSFTRIWYDDVAFRTAVVASNRLERAATVDAAASTTNGVNYVVTDGSEGINVRDFTSLGLGKTHGILEFDISSIPAGAVVTNAMLELDISQFTNSGVDTNQLSIIGYLGDGSATPADATRAGSAIAARWMENLGLMSISLDTTYIQSLAGQSAYLGLRVMESADRQMSFNTNEDPFKALAPTLTIDYTPTPEPATALGVFACGLLMLRRARRR